jgi:hypothetical protein
VQRTCKKKKGEKMGRERLEWKNLENSWKSGQTRLPGALQCQLVCEFAKAVLGSVEVQAKAFELQEAAKSRGRESWKHLFGEDESAERKDPWRPD